MAQSDFAERLDIDGLQIGYTDVMTGDKNRNRFLYYQLKMSMLKANKIDIIVSFLMESGVRMILKDLKAALDRGVQVRILTGNYLGITQPSALCLIKKELGNRVDLRFYNDKDRSFHPKSYIFHYENVGEIYIGSSNISRSALTSGIEWNYRFSSLDDKKNFSLFYDTFVELFENHSLVIDDDELTKYSKNWHKPAVSKDLAKYDNLEDDEDTKVEILFQPRGAQIEALYALEDSRSEGVTKRALGFCCSRQHAEEMAKEFCKRGIEAVAVYSNADGEFSEDRDKAIEKLKKQEIKMIFSVDMFNEGVDIAALDMVMFLRPTESPIVFLQQLGRGLRISKGKEYLNVLDFIGNYEKAGRAPLLLSGGKDLGEKSAYNYADIEYPDDCIVDFDMRLIDLFKELEKKSLSVKERIKQEFYRVKELLDGKVPSRIELFTYMDDDIYQYCMKHAKENPFRRYMEFLNEMHELSVDEKVVYSGIGREFLSLIETTDMQKIYKMPILYSFYNDGDIRLAVKDEDVLGAWKTFFDNGTNWKDFAADVSYVDYKAMTDKQHLSKAKSMPIKFLKASGKGFFIEKDGYAIAIRDDLEEIIRYDAFKKHMKDILEYRTMNYYRKRYEEKEQLK